jgi:dienelactone hydrolase
MILAPFTLDYATSNVTATADVDYVATNGTLSFAEGEMTKTLTLPVLYDEVPEEDEQFRVTLSNPTGGAILGPYATATISILDITNTPPHRFDGIAVQPDRSVQLTLGGSADRHFKDYFDLYPIEVSSNLVVWTPLVTLLRTNAPANVLTYTDTEAASFDLRFYRTASNHLITPWVKPTGPFTPGMVSRLLTDPTRRNRYWLSTNCAFMISVWYPAVAAAGRLPGLCMSLQTAQDPTWMAAYGYGDFTPRVPYLHSHAVPDVPCATDQASYPIVVNSPGWTGQGRIAAAEMGPNLASHGYVVVSVDHYDATRTVFPDGTYLQGDIASSKSPAGLQDRVKDLVFILDELALWNTHDPVFAGRLDLTNVAAMGGSWGGVTASELGRIEDRCKALIGLDPMPFSSAPQLLRLQQPVLQINASGNSDTTPFSMTSNHAIFFQISNSDHMLIAGGDWYWAWYPANVAGGREVARTINAYTLWFLNKYLKGCTDPMPALADYPRVINFKQK